MTLWSPLQRGPSSQTFISTMLEVCFYNFLVSVPPSYQMTVLTAKKCFLIYTQDIFILNFSNIVVDVFIFFIFNIFFYQFIDCRMLRALTGPQSSQIKGDISTFLKFLHLKELVMWQKTCTFWFHSRRIMGKGLFPLNFKGTSVLLWK